MSFIQDEKLNVCKIASGLEEKAKLARSSFSNKCDIVIPREVRPRVTPNIYILPLNSIE